uniref:DUF7666 domain-containing protein n=1 Tax=Myoviridae sp. cthAo37 TaxID=2827701 RepID=A0A8S5S4S3_9CAUD|nr:MAG TPA: hypothetical protein [Myoviridae sp. cthAo37]
MQRLTELLYHSYQIISIKERKIKKMKSYKGFNKDMTCRDFQYEEGKEYEETTAEVCETGFHSCEYPLDCFRYYDPAHSVYHEVEADGEIDKADDGTKLASTKLKIGAELSIAGLVKASIEYTIKRTKKEAGAVDPCGASSATGYRGASSATGDCGASSATGDRGASSATGDCGASSATGDCGASSATGYYGASSATGNYGASSATGDCGASSATGYRGASSADNATAVAIAWGACSKAKGVIGSHLVFADWEYNGDADDDDCEKADAGIDSWTFKGAKMVRVDGETIRENTWYTLRNGEVLEAQ